jgi:hypothetical protein
MHFFKNKDCHILPAIKTISISNVVDRSGLRVPQPISKLDASWVGEGYLVAF